VPSADARDPASLMFAAILCQGRYRNQHKCASTNPNTVFILNS
jgi:hypothetical protein